MPASAGVLLIVAGVLLAVVGVLVATGALSWFGHLPGDIRIEKPAARVYVPITSGLVVSVILTLIAYLIRHWR